MSGRKTGYNRSRPVFFGFSIFWQTSQLATEKIQNLCNRNRWSGLLQLGSVRFRSFFQSSELDLQTLLVIPSLLFSRSFKQVLNAVISNGFCSAYMSQPGTNELPAHVRSTLQCPTYSCRNLVIPVEFQWNPVIPLEFHWNKNGIKQTKVEILIYLSQFSSCADIYTFLFPCHLYSMFTPVLYP